MVCVARRALDWNARAAADRICGPWSTDFYFGFTHLLCIIGIPTLYIYICVSHRNFVVMSISCIRCTIGKLNFFSIFYSIFVCLFVCLLTSAFILVIIWSSSSSCVWCAHERYLSIHITYTITRVNDENDVALNAYIYAQHSVMDLICEILLARHTRNSAIIL